MTKLDYFDIYTKKLFWKVTPVAPGSKNPVLESWNKVYDRDKIRKHFENNPDYNLGICLGQYVDVEADTEKGNRVLSQIIGNTPHPTWRSKRSVHHLFLNPDPLLTKYVIHGVEFRGHNHQSLLPPSVVNGVRYRWASGETVVPEMPKSLLKFYWKNVRRYIRKGVGQTNTERIWCAVCREECHVPSVRLALERQAFNSLNQKWQCKKCRQDIRPLCRRLKRSSKCEPSL